MIKDVAVKLLTTKYGEMSAENIIQLSNTTIRTPYLVTSFALINCVKCCEGISTPDFKSRSSSFGDMK